MLPVAKARLCPTGRKFILLRRLLHTLRVRYTLDMIYTYSGNILIAVSLAHSSGHAIARMPYMLRKAHVTYLRMNSIVGVPASCLIPMECMPKEERPQLAARMQANPHKRLKSLYGGRMMTQYRGIPLGELSPHAYAIAEQARTHLLAQAQLLSRPAQ